MRAVCLALWLLVAAEEEVGTEAAAVAKDMEEDEGNTPVKKYMTDAKAREIANQALPSSLKDLDSRMGIIKGTSIFQLGKIDRLIPIALLNENGDVTLADAIPGTKRTKPITLLDVAKDLQSFCDEKNADLKRVKTDIDSGKGTVVDFQLIDDMAEDPGHPWIHSATYNKTSAMRKLDAVKTVMKGWTDAVDNEIKESLKEYIPPFNVSLQNVSHFNKTSHLPQAGLAWIEGYIQSTRIVLVTAQLLKKFTAKRMAEGLRISNAPLAVPLNVKDYLNLIELATSKVARRIRSAIDVEQHAKPGVLDRASLIETSTGQVDAGFNTALQEVKKLRAAVMREHDAMKAGFLPKASYLLMAYAGVVNAFNNANNITRAALELPPVFLSHATKKEIVLSAILHGHMAELFYGKKLAANQTLHDWGISQHKEGNGAYTFTQDAHAAGKGEEKYQQLRAGYEGRTPGYAAYDRTETHEALHGKLSVAINADGSVEVPGAATAA